MSGSGDIESLKVLRMLRKRYDGEFTFPVFGYQTCINQAIGFLFLGSGSLTFNNTKEALAYVYISTFPKFMFHPNDNETYLQPLRHLYTLACISKVIETRDLETRKMVKTHIKVVYKGEIAEYLETPVTVREIK